MHKCALIWNTHIDFYTLSDLLKYYVVLLRINVTESETELFQLIR